jgi:cell division initiation protein
MKINPSEIKQKTFTLKTFGKGFDREEVTAFLALLAQDWDAMLDENKEQKIKIELLEKEVNKLKEVETSLFRTLKTAEDTSTNLVEQARKTAELKVRESQIKSDVVLNDARNQAREIVQKAQMRARQVMDEMLQEMKRQERDSDDLQRYRNNFLVELKMFLQEGLEKLVHFDQKPPNRFFEEKIREAQEWIEEKNELIDQNAYTIESVNRADVAEVINIPSDEPFDLQAFLAEHAPKDTIEPVNTHTSFFDDEKK